MEPFLAIQAVSLNGIIFGRIVWSSADAVDVQTSNVVLSHRFAFYRFLMSGHFHAVKMVSRPSIERIGVVFFVAIFFVFQLFLSSISIAIIFVNEQDWSLLGRAVVIKSIDWARL